MIRPQNCPCSPTFPASPIPLVADLQPRPSLRSRAFPSPRPAIPFRITSFAHPHHLTPIESYSCKKQGRGVVSSASTQPLPLFSTPSKHPTHSNAHISTLFMRLLNTSHHTRGGGLILDQTLNEASPCRAILARTGFLRLTGHRPRNTGHVFSARLRELCVSALCFSLLSLSTFKPFKLQTSQRRFSATHYRPFTTHGSPQNFYPPAPKLRHNPAAQGQHPQPNPQTGRIQ